MADKSVYEKSEWVDTRFVQEYVDNAEGFILERRRLLGIMKSFSSRFIKKQGRSRVLDLGCGDGILSRELLQANENIALTLLDGSEEMLETAKGLLRGRGNPVFIRSTFQEVIDGRTGLGEYEFIVSSLAIHHLTFEEKKGLFKKICSVLARGGAFLNIDVVAAAPGLESWYLELWETWIAEKERLVPVNKSQQGISKKYKANHDNLPDTLETQLGLLKEAGFKDVDCFYKYGIFTVFGGFKES